MILHIARREEWEAAQAAGDYRADTLLTEGFIHCSTPAQVLGPANALFHGQSDLMLLVIEPARLAARLEEGGLVAQDSVEQDSGPEKHIYSLTAAGRAELADWFASGVPAEHETRSHRSWTSRANQGILTQ